MNVLGFDQDSKHIGVVIASFPDAYKQPEVLYSDTLRITRKNEMEKLSEYINALKYFTDDFGGDLHYAIREGSFFDTTRPMGGFQVERIGGIIEAHVYLQFGLRTDSAKASEWRQEVFGNGWMRREQAKQTAMTYVQATHPEITSEHECEAICIAKYEWAMEKDKFWNTNKPEDDDETSNN